MTDIATITLRANVSEIQSASQTLDKFQQSSDSAAKSADHLSDEMEQVHKRVSDLRQKMLTTESATKKNADAQDVLAESFLKQISGIKLASDANARLMNISKLMREERKAGNLDNGNYLELISQISRKTRELSNAEQLASVKREVFLKKLKDQVAVQSLSRTELLRFQAAQLGASSAASRYIDMLDKSGKSAHSLGLKSAAARREIGILFGEVARGNFGALRGSSITLANRAGWIDKLMTLRGLGIATVVGGIAAAVYGLGKAWYEGSQEATEFNKQLILTGNYAGKTAGQLQSLAKSLSGNGVTQQATAEALAKVVGNGSFSGNAITMIADTAAKLKESVGQSVDDTISQFKRIQNEPVQAIKELDNQYHFLTATQLEQITTLEEQGRKTDAAKLAMESYATAMRERASGIKENLGALEKAWKWLGDAASSAWDKMLNIGREKSVKDKIRDIQEQLVEFQINPASKGIYFNYTGKTADDLKKDLAILQEQDYQASIKVAREDADRNEEERKKRQFQADQSLKKEYETAEEKHQRRLLEIRNSAASEGQKQIAIQRENDLFAQKQSRKSGAPREKAYTDDSATKMLQASKQRLAALVEQAGVTSQLTEQEKRLAEFNQQIADLKEKKILTADQKNILTRADEIKQSLELEASESRRIKNQQELVKLHEQALKYSQQIDAKASVLLDSAGLSGRDIQRNREREQLKLANYSPEDYTSLSKKLEDYYSKEDELRGDWLAGAKKGWAEYRDSATNVYDAMQSVAQSTFSGISDMMTSLVTTGTASFKQFAASILKMIAEVINKLLVAWTVQQAMGWISGSFGGGGSTPSGAYTSAAANVDFDTGGYTGDGGKYEPKGIVHGGEFVFTKAATSAIGVDNLYAIMRNAQGYADGGFVGRAPMYGLNNNAGVGNTAPVINTIVNVEANGNASAQTNSSGDAMGRALAEEMQNAATMVVQKHLKPGGMIYNFSKGR